MRHRIEELEGSTESTGQPLEHQDAYQTLQCNCKISRQNLLASGSVPVVRSAAVVSTHAVEASGVAAGRTIAFFFCPTLPG